MPSQRPTLSEFYSKTAFEFNSKTAFEFNRFLI